MCGIVGVIQYRSKIERELRAKAIRILFSEMMLRTEIRGEDATGIFQLQADGDWMLAKKGQKVSEWLYLDRGDGEIDPVVYRDFMETWDQHPIEMTALIGHCRKATIGTKGKDNDDNHPFAVQLDERNAILGVHNGTLDNHEVIFKNLGGHLKRQGSVDSESIFHLLYYATDHGTKPIDGDALKYLGERLEGAYAVVTANSRFPEKVAVFRDGRPLEMMLVSPLNVVLLASEKRMLEAALAEYKFVQHMLEPDLPDLSTDDRALAERDFRIFDTTKEFPEKVDWQAFQDISERGEVRKYAGSAILEEWRKPSKTASTNTGGHTTGNPQYGGNRPASQGTTGGNYSAKVSKDSSGGGGTDTTRVLPAAAGKNTDKGTIVDATIKKADPGSAGEAKHALEKARSLGLCTHYDVISEVAKSLGVSCAELGEFDTVELANQLAATHFVFGYALARVDSKAEIEEVRERGRTQLSRMEKTIEKQRRAENIIWELKNIIQIGMALAASGFPITQKNLGVALGGFNLLTPGRRKDVLRTAKDIFEDQHAQTLVRELTDKFRQVAARKAAEDQASSEGE